MQASKGWVGALIAGSLLFAGSLPLSAQIPDYNWYPGYYVLNSIDTAARKQLILDDPLVEPFTGVQFRYHWAASELSPGDYSAGFATLDADLERVTAKGKKILVMLMYKKFDGTSAVPADLRTGPGPWCSGPYCGEFTTGSGSSLALLWNPVVEARLNAWITAMAQHLSESPYIDNVAGIVFNETSLGTTNTTELASANYDPYVYIQAHKDNMFAATTAAPRLITIIYFEGGFVSMDGNSVKAGEKIGDWMLLNPRTGAGTPDLNPKEPKGTNHPCANSKYQSHIACAPAVQANDYATAITDSFDQSFFYATNPVPDGLHASFFTFSYAVGAGPNAFTFADVSNNIANYPIPNIARPWPVTPVNGSPVAADDTATVVRGGTLNMPAPGVLSNDIDPESDPLAVNTTPVTFPANGSLTLDANGSFTYIHNGGVTFNDAFVYQVCDTEPLCDTATVNLTITPANGPPVAADDTATVPRGGTLNLPAPGVLSNDIDPESDPIAVNTTPVTLPANGSLTLNANGSFTYIHNGSVTLSDAFVYQVCDTEPLCDTATVNLTITAPSLDLIFADGFESGDLFAWTSGTIDLGDLSVSGAAALVGSKGLQAQRCRRKCLSVSESYPPLLTVEEMDLARKKKTAAFRAPGA